MMALKRYRPTAILFLSFPVACILSFYSGVYTGIKVGHSQCHSSSEVVRGLKGALDSSVGAGSRDGSSDNNGGELSIDKVQRLVREKVDLGE
jgi:hypothetical protein